MTAPACTRCRGWCGPAELFIRGMGPDCYAEWEAAITRAPKWAPGEFEKAVAKDIETFAKQGVFPDISAWDVSDGVKARAKELARIGRNPPRRARP